LGGLGRGVRPGPLAWASLPQRAPAGCPACPGMPLRGAGHRGIPGQAGRPAGTRWGRPGQAGGRAGGRGPPGPSGIGLEKRSGAGLGWVWVEVWSGSGAGLGGGLDPIPEGRVGGLYPILRGRVGGLYPILRGGTGVSGTTFRGSIPLKIQEHLRKLGGPDGVQSKKCQNTGILQGIGGPLFGVWGGTL